MVESVKAAVLGDARFFSWLERNLDKLLSGEEKSLTQAIETSVKIKARIVSADERETGQRMLLNLGHTVGHAIEAATNYRTLLHGEAVAWGMLAALHLAVARNALPPAKAAAYRRPPVPPRALSALPRVRTGIARSNLRRQKTFADRAPVRSTRRHRQGNRG